MMINTYKNHINLDGTIGVYNDKIKKINLENYLKGIHINIRNAKKNSDYFKVMLQTINQKMDIIGWSETWLNREEATVFGINYEDYEWIWSNKKFNKNGGVGIAINRAWHYRVFENIGINLEADNLIIEIRDDNNNSYIVIMIYRNPSRNLEEFITELEKIIEANHIEQKNTIIIGDMNIDVSIKG